MQRPDAVLFDLDGTIIDSRVPFATSVNYTLAAVGRPERKPEELWHYLGPPTHQTFTELLGDDERLVDTAIAIYRDHYAKTSADTTFVYEGIPELLRSLHGRVALAVATSKIVTNAVMLLESLGLAELFDVISGPLPSAINEPKAVTVSQALTSLGGPKRAVMVGDRCYDVVGGHEHGLPTIGVLWGAGSEAELREAGADAIVSAPAEIPPLLDL
ncbi:MAG TPA: HAD hydrolase-like protein [Solirubrobacteraceae bacterium]|jgi:phosphoglycolate phosphatase|nr:HAD hydrolase-like protein [Solirubrobacteraceae bacterium]